MKVSELKFEDHPAGLGGTHCVVKFDNGYGASIITGEKFYTNKNKPYELGVLYEDELTYNTDLTDDVLGYLDEEEVNDYLEKIEAL